MNIIIIIIITRYYYYPQVSHTPGLHKWRGPAAEDGVRAVHRGHERRHARPRHQLQDIQGGGAENIVSSCVAETVRLIKQNVSVSQAVQAEAVKQFRSELGSSIFIIIYYDENHS